MIYEKMVTFENESESDNQAVWLIWAGSKATIFTEFQKNNLIAIGYGIKENIADVHNKKEIEKIVRECNPGHSGRDVNIIVNQIKKFKDELKKRDVVVSWNKGKTVFLLGEIQNDRIEYNSEIIPLNQHRLTKKVKWLEQEVSEKVLEKELPVFEDEFFNPTIYRHPINKLKNNEARKEIIMEKQEYNFRIEYEVDKESGQIVATIPELNHISSFGNNFAEAEANVREAAVCYIET